LTKTKVRVGDIVARRSYKGDLLFEVVAHKGGEYLLKGLNLRLLADAPEHDLILISKTEVDKTRKLFFRQTLESLKRIFSERVLGRTQLRNSQYTETQYIELPGKVLHLDGDAEYLNLCLDYYRQLGIPAVGHCVEEKEQPKRVEALLSAHRPDLLVLTGHDAMFKGRQSGSLKSYRHSVHFVEAVQKARQLNGNKDSLVIFAGACQSHFEALMEAGANFASSPERVFIHPFDPLFIIEKVAYTPISKIASPKQVLANSVVGLCGIGGIQTRGQLRLGLPKTAAWQGGRGN
jgi:spore coat assembly protein